MNQPKSIGWDTNVNLPSYNVISKIYKLLSMICMGSENAFSPEIAKYNFCTIHLGYTNIKLNANSLQWQVFINSFYYGLK